MLAIGTFIELPGYNFQNFFQGETREYQGDTYIFGGFGFLFGEANLDLSIGLFSFARYADDVPRSSPRFLRRCGMVLCHEASHLFGIKHCVYASCVMNGSNHLEESESRPFALCPVDLRKIQLTLDQARVDGKATPPVDLVARERGLLAFFEAHGLDDDA